MKIEFAKNIIASFDKSTFHEFVITLLKKGCGEDYIKTVPYSPLIKSLYINSPVYYNHFFVFDFLPYEVFKSLKTINIITDSIREQIKQIPISLERGFMLGDIYFINNLYGHVLEEYQEYITPQLEIASKPLLNPNQEFGFGNIDTFFNNETDLTIEVLENFLLCPNGFSISINRDGFNISEYINQNISSVGVTNISKSPLSYVAQIKSQNELLTEFQEVLNSFNETKLERFIKQHYKEVFGEKYERIETQLWLRFPEFDSNNSNRRLDVLLKNTISGDWDIFELKKDLNITTTYRGTDVFKSVVYKSIDQLRNYSQVLNQAQVMEYLKREGIEIFSPELHLVIGYKPNNIAQANWRKLISQNSKDIKLISYDSLLNEMRVRNQAIKNFLEQI